MNKLFIMLTLALIVPASAVAYVSSYGYAPYATTSYGSYGSPYDGNWGLVSRSPYPYPSTYRLAEDRLTYGEYSRFTGRYHHPYTGRTMPETWYGYGSSNAIPTRSYPYTWQTIHRE